MQVAMAVCRDKYTHPIPPNVDLQISTILKSCWSFEPHKRPTFVEIYRKLEPIASKFGVDSN